MRKIILFIASSLDGYIARDSGDIDWLFTDQDYGYTEFIAQIDTLIMGNKTYQQILTFGEYPYQDQEVFVFSKTYSGETNNGAKYINSDWEDFIKTLRTSNGRDIWLVGGAQLIHFFLKHGFIDELILSIHPIILGSGIPLILKDPTIETKLQLQDVKSFDTGLVQIFYNLTY
ncbi:bifunctional deaminase-reductase-like protein [Trichormus variabilis ATCC 29413]|uniref:Bifunctional deaminase-reductase-like protein n=2 Tax=Anabaena variabilis TaxID=264691 RepID=Q3M517_TRIV2|nr:MULTISPECIES: dihydrofolate reductase family protein [Nostocaceae]ABA23919.1 bifunctional deaminase-reductase-like protein [Trichormus variabilis ATCC 29413]MBC1215653.1 dihydrofolate reductase [Trichormus variabilis ARAD]MBC1255955.1 dihydrofolate reductase [Trichormus variabilis V5]MBC1266711.1 dihydrofolate reductase [Trichormus variabilis FSR]MBC1300494.1 dihydrofolate reductase [Trichormus variabilis N2B]